MSLVAMGISHKTAPIDVRQRVAIPESDIPGALISIVNANGVKEALLLSTCNRVEAYVEAKTDRLGANALETFFRERAGESFDASCFYLHRGMDAVQHVLRVVSSLDSQVLGEAQILGQMREAFERSQATGTCGEVLTELFKRALNLGKRVRSETMIGADSVSLSTVAHRIARDACPDLSGARVLLVGAGEMARLSARYLLDDGVGELFVTSRTPAHAALFAEETGAQVVPFEQRYAAAAQADIVFTMTSAKEPVINCNLLAAARVNAGRNGQPLVFIDEAEEGFLSWMQERLVVPTIKSIYEKGNITVSDELDRAINALAKQRGAEVSDEERAVLAAYGNAIMKKLLHGPTVRLRKEAQTADSYYYTGAARYLFGIDAFPPGTRHTCHMRLCEQGKPCPMGLEGSMRDACQVGREQR